MNEMKTLAIDLAKNIFELYGLDQFGKSCYSKRVKRADLSRVDSTIPKVTIAMEACSSSFYWARVFQKMGHEVKLISPQFVKPFVKSMKNDRNDAEAIAFTPLM